MAHGRVVGNVGGVGPHPKAKKQGRGWREGKNLLPNLSKAMGTSLLLNKIKKISLVNLYIAAEKENILYIFFNELCISRTIL